MSGSLLLFVGCIYLYVAADQCMKNNVGLGFAFFGYALSNIGLFYAAR